MLCNEGVQKCSLLGQAAREERCEMGRARLVLVERILAFQTPEREKPTWSKAVSKKYFKASQASFVQMEKNFNLSNMNRKSLNLILINCAPPVSAAGREMHLSSPSAVPALTVYSLCDSEPAAPISLSSSWCFSFL